MFGSPGFRGAWHPESALCLLTDSYVLAEDTTPAMIGATLAHEAMHAFLDHWGIGYLEEQRGRVERLCFRAAIAFAKRLPDTESDSRGRILEENARQLRLPSHRWTDEGMLEYKRQNYRDLGASERMISLMERLDRASLRWERRRHRAQAARRYSRAVSARPRGHG